MTFKERLKAARHKAGLTQAEAAAAARVPLRTYQNWEGGSREPRLAALAALARALDVTADELVGVVRRKK